MQSLPQFRDDVGVEIDARSHVCASSRITAATKEGTSAPSKSNEVTEPNHPITARKYPDVKHSTTIHYRLHILRNGT
jgi:hypothetical protein